MSSRTTVYQFRRGMAVQVIERYPEHGDLYQQLHNTLVELDGELCHIVIADGWEYHIRRPVRDAGRVQWGPAELENIKEADLNLEPFPLGYVNFERDCAYLRRKPLRKWKQGLYADYLEYVYPKDHRRAHRVSLTHTGMIDLYDNNYPTFRRAWTEVFLFERPAMAWHRDWAFQHNTKKKRGLVPLAGGLGKLKREPPEVELMYKGRRVGKVVDGNVMIDHEYRYITEAFVEAMIHAT